MSCDGGLIKFTRDWIMCDEYHNHIAGIIQTVTTIKTIYTSDTVTIPILPNIKVIQIEYFKPYVMIKSNLDHHLKILEIMAEQDSHAKSLQQYVLKQDNLLFNVLFDLIVMIFNQYNDSELLLFFATAPNFKFCPINNLQDNIDMYSELEIGIYNFVTRFFLDYCPCSIQLFSQQLIEDYLSYKQKEKF